MNDEVSVLVEAEQEQHAEGEGEGEVFRRSVEPLVRIKAKTAVTLPTRVSDP